MRPEVFSLSEALLMSQESTQETHLKTTTAARHVARACNTSTGAVVHSVSPGQLGLHTERPCLEKNKPKKKKAGAG